MKQIVAGLVLATSVFPFFVGAKTVIQMTDKGFVPDTVSIAVGDVVFFENVGREDHWPASNPHPVHTMYPEFDPRHPVLQGDSWSYTFARAGTWNFHDHLSPNHLGTIYVGISGSTTAVVPSAAGPSLWSRITSAISLWWHSIASKFSSPAKISFEYIDPSPSEVDGLYKKWKLPCSSHDFDCASGALTQITALQGPRVAGAFLKRLQQDQTIDRSVDDHQIMHRIGRQTAKTFGETGDAFRMCPMSDFNGGCQHGFFEQVLGHASSTTSAAEKICGPMKGVTSDKVYFDCYHGVGHGVMMAQAYDLKASLDVCDALSDPTGQDGCWQGVFMENVNGAMTGAVRPGVFSMTDPLQPCNMVAEKYQHECYLNQFGWLMQATGNSAYKASRACLHASDRERNACLESIGLATTNPSWQLVLTSASGSEIEKAWSICQEFPAGYVDQCIIGAIDNAMNFDQLNTTRSAAFCALIPASFHDICYRQIGVNIHRQQTSSTDVAALCAALPGKDACMDGTTK